MDGKYEPQGGALACLVAITSAVPSRRTDRTYTEDKGVRMTTSTRMQDTPRRLPTESQEMPGRPSNIY